MAIFGISDMVYRKQWYFYKYQIEMHLIYIKKVAQYKFRHKDLSLVNSFFVWIQNRNSSHNSARPQTLSLALMASTTHNQPTHKP